MNNQVKYPFSAILGQEDMKEALLLNLVNPAIGGVLIRGHRGTAKSTAVRAVENLVKDIKVVNLPINATEDRLAGTLDIEHVLKTGEKKFEEGLLAKANGNILYVDEINLLDDSLIDMLLDAAATGVNTVERDGISYSHEAKFVLVGTMNPEEGELRPQLLDRFGMVVDVAGEKDPDIRIRIMEARLLYEKDPEEFFKKFSRKDASLRKKIKDSKKLLADVKAGKEILTDIAQIGINYGTEGHRFDISTLKVARTIAALAGRTEVKRDDLLKAVKYTLPHRMSNTGNASIGQMPKNTDIESVLQKSGDDEQEGG